MSLSLQVGRTLGVLLLGAQCDVLLSARILERLLLLSAGSLEGLLLMLQGALTFLDGGKRRKHRVVDVSDILVGSSCAEAWGAGCADC